jgi:hypothetical protein
VNLFDLEDRSSRVARVLIVETGIDAIQPRSGIPSGDGLLGRIPNVDPAHDDFLDESFVVRVQVESVSERHGQVLVGVEQEPPGRYR